MPLSKDMDNQYTRLYNYNFGDKYAKSKEHKHGEVESFSLYLTAAYKM
jgi:hypothetical protein